MSADLSLDSLLRALRHAGLRIGVTEVVRLREVFVREPKLPVDDEAARRRLAALLQAVLVKSETDRRLFERVLSAWLVSAEQEVRLHDKELTAPVERAPFPRRRRFPFWRLAAALLILAIGVIVDRDTRDLPQTNRETTGQETKLPEEEPQPWAEQSSLEELRKRTFQTWVPFLQVIPGDQTWAGWPALGLGVFAMLVSGVLWVLLHRRRWVPEPSPEPQRRGPPRVFLSPPPLPGPQLLLPQEQEALAWGISRFLTDEPTRRLDLAATVRATAKAAGLPQLIFHRASQYREVWLWLDETSEDPALARLADEVEAVLAAHGLPVERASFRGLPFELFGSEGHVFAPAEVDERRDFARVAVLTDGRVLSRQYSADDRRTRIDALLRGISHWPQLAFFEFSSGNLAPVLGPHGIEVLPPQRLVGWLAGSAGSAYRGVSTAPERGAPVSGEEAAWAAACALSPSPIDEATAILLRRWLGIAPSPWVLRALQAEAPGPPGRLQWRPLDRARRVNWLRNAEAQPAEKEQVVRGSLLDRALTFWENAYETEIKQRATAEASAPWENTPAQQHLAMERELLRLWRDPGLAARRLYALHRGGLREPIQAQLGALAPAGRGGEGLIELPWRWDQRSSTEKLMLQEMALGGGLPPVRLRRPGRLWLGWAACLGLAMGALITAATSGMEPRQPGSLVVLGDGTPGDAWFLLPPLESEGGQVAVGTRKSFTATRIAAGEAVSVQWRQQDQLCVEPLGALAEVWWCGRRGAFLAQLPVSRARSIVLLDVPLGTRGADQLAAALLDSRSADLVIVGSELPSDLGLGLGLANQQILTIAPASFRKPQSLSSLAEALQFDGSRTAAQVWPRSIWKKGDGSRIWLHGLGTGCQPREYEENSMNFVELCPGDFLMGANDNSPDEQPVHKVQLSAFSIGKYEVTNEQYRRFRSDHPGEANLPATDVSWHDAQKFCEQLGFRLPTEAEWEYAARAGTSTAWSFGDDGSQLTSYAWFSENSGGRAHPVGQKQANPWGLHDMYGNAWEWVADWYGAYPQGAVSNPRGPVEGRYKVLRGGSFGDPPWVLRSAYRDWDGPGLRLRFIGFRCSRSPRRQP